MTMSPARMTAPPIRLGVDLGGDADLLAQALGACASANLSCCSSVVARARRAPSILPSASCFSLRSNSAAISGSARQAAVLRQQANRFLTRNRREPCRRHRRRAQDRNSFCSRGSTSGDQAAHRHRVGSRAPRPAVRACPARHRACPSSTAPARTRPWRRVGRRFRVSAMVTLDLRGQLRRARRHAPWRRPRA